MKSHVALGTVAMVDVVDVVEVGSEVDVGVGVVVDEVVVRQAWLIRLSR